MNKVKLGKKQLLYYSFMKCFRIFPIDRKKIVVSNFRGKGYGDNPKYIIENLRKRKERYTGWLKIKMKKCLKEFM